MGDFPQHWKFVRALSEGGQGFTFVVQRQDQFDTQQYVLKRLKNPKREDYFEREIQACKTLEHPNVLRVLEHGRTPKGKLYLITPYCEGGSLDHQPKFHNLLEGIIFFQQICVGVAHAHEQGISHLDLKPANILINQGRPVVGDFGICYIEEGQIEMTSEGPRGSLYYCAPELRGPKIRNAEDPKTADVYSLGKILYWLFTHEVYDGSEDDYTDDTSRQLAKIYPEEPLFTLVDQLIKGMVQRNLDDRRHAGFETAKALLKKVTDVSNRVQAGGRALNPHIPQRCLYCASGVYRPIPVNNFIDLDSTLQYASPNIIGDVDDRAQDRLSKSGLSDAAEHFLGHSYGNVQGARLLILICDYCGNFQQFRLDQTRDRYGKNWRP